MLETKEATKRRDAVVCGRGKIEGIDVLAAIFDFSFMGGSLGSVVGEKITRLLEEGKEKRLPVIVFCASGRRQDAGGHHVPHADVEGLRRHIQAQVGRIPYITVLTDPTLGGVSASIAMLGDIIIGEPKAMIGFAGPRVIKETIKAELPQGFQRTEYLLEHGMIDLISPEKELRKNLHDILSLVTA